VIGSPWMMSVASRLGVSRQRTQTYQMLLSVEEAADVLRLGRTRTYELVMAKKIQSVKVGRHRLVVRSSLLDFVRTLLLEQECA